MCIQYMIVKLFRIQLKHNNVGVNRIKQVMDYILSFRYRYAMNRQLIMQYQYEQNTKCDHIFILNDTT